MLARSSGCTYHCDYSTGQPDLFTPRIPRLVTCPGSGIATCLNRVIDMAGLSPAGLRPCRLLPAPVPRIGTLTLVGPPLKFLPCHRSDRFPGSMQKPGSGSRHLYTGGHLGSKQVSPKLYPEPYKEAQF